MRRRVGERTVGYCAERKSSETFLLRKVHPRWNLWGVGISGPGCSRRLRHGQGVIQGILVDGWVRGSETNDGDLEFPRIEVQESADYKHSRTEFVMHTIWCAATQEMKMFLDSCAATSPGLVISYSLDTVPTNDLHQYNPTRST